MVIQAGSKMKCFLMLTIIFFLGCSPSDSNPDSNGVSPKDGGLTGDGALAGDASNNNPLSVMTYTGRVTDNWQVVIPKEEKGDSEPFLWRNWLVTLGSLEEGCSLYGYEIQGDVTNPTYAAKKLLFKIDGAAAGCGFTPVGPWLVGGVMFGPPGAGAGGEQLVLGMNSDKTLTIKSRRSIEGGVDDPLGNLLAGTYGIMSGENGSTTITNYGSVISQGTIDDQGNFGASVTTLGSLEAFDKDRGNVRYLVCDNYVYSLGGSGGCGTCCFHADVHVASLLDTNRKWTATRNLPLGPATVHEYFCANGFVYVGWIFTDPSGTGCMAQTIHRELFAAKIGKDGALSQWIKATNIYPTCDNGTSTTPVRGNFSDINSNFALSFCDEAFSVAPLERGVWVPPTSSAGGDGGTGQPVNQNECTGSDVVWCANYQVCLPTTGECEYWCRIPSSLVQCFRSMPDEAEQDLFCGTSPVRNLCQ